MVNYSLLCDSELLISIVFIQHILASPANNQWQICWHSQAESWDEFWPFEASSNSPVCDTRRRDFSLSRIYSPGFSV